MNLIDRQAAYEALTAYYHHTTDTQHTALHEALSKVPPADAVEVVLCKDCKHQEKYFYADKRLKNGGRYSYGCDLAEGYSHVCLDDDFCSRGERKDG